MTTMRFYQYDDDYWRIRAFLREIFLLNGRQELSWQTARLDYWRFFINVHIDCYELNKAIGIWETADNQIVGMIIPDGKGNAYLNSHPNFRTAELEADMVNVAENTLAQSDGDSASLTVWAHQHDELRQQVLTGLGYVRGEHPEYQRGRSLDGAIPTVSLADGFTIRSLSDATEIPARSWLSWRVFHPDEPDKNYGGYDWYDSIQRCPLYRRDLDLVAVAPHGELAAFCTVWYDDVTRTGLFEPVGTSPDYQGMGLGKAIMTEGLRRVQHLGAVHATVAGYSQAANALYSSVMSSEYLLYERWHKHWSL